MASQNQNKGVTDIGGATLSSAPRSIVDAYVYGPIFPGNYWRTLYELTQLYQKKELDSNDRLKLKLLAAILIEQLLGQLSVNSVKVLRLMEEYVKANNANRGEKHD